MREQFGKYGDSTAQRAILRAPKDSTITLNNRGQLLSIDPGYRQPTKLAIRRARSAPDTSSIITHKKPKVETAVRSRRDHMPSWALSKNESHQFAIPEIPKNRRRLPPFAHTHSPSLANRLAQNPLVDPKIAELALMRVDAIAASKSSQSVELASPTHTKSVKTSSTKSSTKTMQSVRKSKAQPKGKQRAKKVTKIKAESKPAKTKKQTKNKQAIVSSFHANKYKMES